MSLQAQFAQLAREDGRAALVTVTDGLSHPMFGTTDDPSPANEAPSATE